MPAPESLDGNELFKQYRCVRCHTIGRGRFVGPDLAGVGDRYTKAQILRWIENPQLVYNASGRMPMNPGYPPMPPARVPSQAAEPIADYIASAKVTGDPTSGGTISGQVVSGGDGTPGGEMEVTLTPFMADNADPETTVKSDSEGRFLFKGLPWDRSYTVRVNYKGAQYSTDKMVFSPEEDSKTLRLPVYEPSDSDENIKIDEAHLILQVADGNVSVADLSVLNNTGDTVNVGAMEISDGRKESLKYSLPEKAADIKFIHGLEPGSVVTTEGGFSDTQSVLPGPKRAVFSYIVPLDSGKAVLDKTINYPTASFLLLAADTGDEFTVKGLEEQEPAVIQNERYLKWTGSNLKPGHRVVIDVKSASTGEGGYIKWAALGFLGVIILAGILYSALRGSNKEEEYGAAEAEGDMNPGASDLEEKRSALIKEIAALDDKYQTGGVEHNTYTGLREEKKKELLDLTRRLLADQKSPK